MTTTTARPAGPARPARIIHREPLLRTVFDDTGVTPVLTISLVEAAPASP